MVTKLPARKRKGLSVGDCTFGFFLQSFVCPIFFSLNYKFNNSSNSSLNSSSNSSLNSSLSNSQKDSFFFINNLLITNSRRFTYIGVATCFLVARNANPQENLGVYPINHYTIPASVSVIIDHTQFCQNRSSSFPNSN